MVGQREVELDSDLVRDPGMVGELLAAVELDGSERLAFEGPRHLVPDALGGLTAALPADEEAVFAVDERQQAGASGFAGNRVALPMPGLAALVGGRRPLRNLVRHLDFATPLRRAAAALAAMAQPSLRLAPADAAVEETTAYAAVDGRVADGLPPNSSASLPSICSGDHCSFRNLSLTSENTCSSSSTRRLRHAFLRSA